MKTVVVIPAYNEEKTIAKVIEGLLCEGYREIVVVDDGSTDATDDIVRHFPVHLVNHLFNLGQGAALQTGNDYALDLGAEAIVHFDADGQHQIKDVQKFVDKIDDNYDVVLGSRFLCDNQQLPFTKKHFILKPGILLNWIFTGLKLTDVHNGFRALNRTAAQKIRIKESGMAHNTEIVKQINHHQLKFIEIPVEILYHEYGQGFAGGLKIVSDLVKSKILR